VVERPRSQGASSCAATDNCPGPMVNLKGTKIVGSLRFIGREVRIPTVLNHCWFDNSIQLHHAQTGTIHLLGSWFPSLNAVAGVINGDPLSTGWAEACAIPP
jgi:hypothetical protein